MDLVIRTGHISEFVTISLLFRMAMSFWIKPTYHHQFTLPPSFTTLDCAFLFLILHRILFL